MPVPILCPGFDKNKKMPQMGHFTLLADGEGFEPPDELPRQRFSRPSHSTTLPTIRNSQCQPAPQTQYYSIFFQNATIN